MSTSKLTREALAWKAEEVRAFVDKQRRTEKEAEEEKAREQEARVCELFDWVLDMLRHPTAFNTRDKVTLAADTKGKGITIIRIGETHNEGCLTDRVYDSEDMKLLEKMVNQMHGYFAKFHPDDYPNARSYIDIIIE